MNIWKFSSPFLFYKYSSKLVIIFGSLSLILFIIGAYFSLFISPVDSQQGEVYRIIFIHVPSAWMSMLIYLVMGFWSFIGLIFNTRLSFILSHACAKTGAIMCLIALITGSIWGKPTWGTWWVWDARLTSELVLFFLYIGYISLFKSIESFKKADQVCAYIAIFGTINIPIIYFSVKWWATLHQGASLSFDGGSQIDSVMLISLLIMTFAFWFYCIAIILFRAKTIVIYRESQKSWLKKDILNAS